MGGRTRHFLSQLSLALTLVGAMHTAAAQVGIGVQAVVGYYRPLGHFDPASVYSTDLPEKPSDLSGALWGGSVQVQFWKRGAIEASAVTAASRTPVCECPGGFVVGNDLNRVTVATIEGQYDISNKPSRYHLWIGAGPAMIHHTGVGYGRHGSPRSWGGAAGLEVAAALVTSLQLVGSVSGATYAFDLSYPPEHGRQFDAMLTLGLRWHGGS